MFTNKKREIFVSRNSFFYGFSKLYTLNLNYIGKFAIMPGVDAANFVKTGFACFQFNFPPIL